jgi:hypothetical protein
MQAPPYMMSVKNIPAILEKIKGAGTPPKFTYEFLKANLGFASSADRGIVAQLKYLKFISDDGTPTDRYNQFRGTQSKAVLAAAIRDGYSEVFLADQKADQKTFAELKEMFKSLTGKAEDVSKKMASTFKALCTQANFQADAPVSEGLDVDLSSDDENNVPQEQKTGQSSQTKITPSLTLRHDVHVHLPATSDVSVYKAIFRAINDELSD